MKALKERALEARRTWESRENGGKPNRSAFARAVGVTPSAIQQIEAGKTLTLDGDTLAGYVRATGFMVDWLQHGRGPKEQTRVREAVAEYIEVPVRNGKVSAGHGRPTAEISEIGSILFRPRSMAKKGISPEHAQVWYVADASMFPRLREGDAVLFDTSDLEVLDGKLYVIEWGGTTYVKRLYRELDGLVRVVSDNPAPEFRDRLVQPEDPGFKVLGRVRWIGSWEE